MTKRTFVPSLGFLWLVAAASLNAAPADPPLPPGGAAILTWTPEQQAWGYRNMEKLAPVRVFKRGKTVHPLPLGAQIDPTFKVGDKTYNTESYMREFRASGVLVIKNGKIVLERYGLGRGPKDRWTSFSVAKSLTSTLIGAALKDGKIKSLDDAVTLYIPELKGSAYEGVSVRQLITMTSGVKWNESYTDPNSDVAKVGLSILEPGVNPVVSYMRRLPREAAPGAKFVYKTGETDLAGILLSNAVGEPLGHLGRRCCRSRTRRLLREHDLERLRPRRAIHAGSRQSSGTRSSARRLDRGRNGAACCESALRLFLVDHSRRLRSRGDLRSNLVHVSARPVGRGHQFRLAGCLVGGHQRREDEVSGGATGLDPIAFQRRWLPRSATGGVS
jgi:hypothetical protein